MASFLSLLPPVLDTRSKGNSHLISSERQWSTSDQELLAPELFQIFENFLDDPQCRWAVCSILQLRGLGDDRNEAERMRQLLRRTTKLLRQTMRTKSDQGKAIAQLQQVSAARGGMMDKTETSVQKISVFTGDDALKSQIFESIEMAARVGRLTDAVIKHVQATATSNKRLVEKHAAVKRMAENAKRTFEAQVDEIAELKIQCKRQEAIIRNIISDREQAGHIQGYGQKIAVTVQDIEPTNGRHDWKEQRIQESLQISDITTNTHTPLKETSQTPTCSAAGNDPLPTQVMCRRLSNKCHHNKLQQPESVDQAGRPNTAKNTPLPSRVVRPELSAQSVGCTFVEQANQAQEHARTARGCSEHDHRRLESDLE